MTYTQTDIDDGTVTKIGDNYYLSTDIEKVLAIRIQAVEVQL